MYDTTYLSGNQPAPLNEPPPPRRSSVQCMRQPFPLQLCCQEQYRQYPLPQRQWQQPPPQRLQQPPRALQQLQGKESISEALAIMIRNIDQCFRSLDQKRDLFFARRYNQKNQQEQRPTTTSSKPIASQALPPLPPVILAPAVAVPPTNQTASSATTSRLFAKADETSYPRARSRPDIAHPPSCQTAPLPLYHLPPPLIINPITHGDLYNEFDWKELGPSQKSVLLSHTLLAAARHLFTPFAPPQFTRLSHSKTTRPAHFFQK